MKILNLYAGIGGNRKLWGDEHEITSIEYREDIAEVYRHYFPNDNLIVTDAHQYLLDHYNEFDFIWSSPPCQTHSRARRWNTSCEIKYPDMKLWQEIIFLDSYCKGKYVVENVIPYYEPLVTPSKKLGRHLFWSNFKIGNIPEIKEADIKNGTREEWSSLHGFDLSGFKINSRKDQIYRNCVHPETGLHILNFAKGIFENKTQQIDLFNL